MSQEILELQKKIKPVNKLVGLFMALRMETVSAFEAKTHLSELLKKVQSGEIFMITHRGKPIAKLVPYSETSDLDSKNAVQSLREIRASVSGSVDIGEFIQEGRKW
ncbi:type II toxin-antitoxin system Phd/YefM family antitoxin [Leptospira wolffii]|nr:type II toxin-antitoxin system prevent-host-death family antitoxin [Leptospira wolffii]